MVVTSGRLPIIWMIYILLFDQLIPKVKRVDGNPEVFWQLD